MKDTIKLFVGCSPDGIDAESLAVLEYSARKNTKKDIEIVWMKLSKDPNSFWYSNPETKEGWNTTQWATPFSGFRWAIPAYCNFEGRAIYCDSDFIFMADLDELWKQEFNDGKVVIAKGGENSWRYCSCLWNCETAKEYILPINKLRENEYAHQRMMNFFANNGNIVQDFKGNWNCVDLENYKSPFYEDIKAIHYSSMQHQVHLKHALKRLESEGRKHWFDGKVEPHWREDLQELFDTFLEEAKQNGFTPENYFSNEKFGNIIKESQKNYQHAHEWIGNNG